MRAVGPEPSHGLSRRTHRPDNPHQTASLMEHRQSRRISAALCLPKLHVNVPCASSGEGMRP